MSTLLKLVAIFWGLYVIVVALGLLLEGDTQHALTIAQRCGLAFPTLALGILCVWPNRLLLGRRSVTIICLTLHGVVVVALVLCLAWTGLQMLLGNSIGRFPLEVLVMAHAIMLLLFLSAPISLILALKSSTLIGSPGTDPVGQPRVPHH